MLNLKKENAKLLSQMQNGIVNLKACIDNQHAKEHIRNTSTPKIRCEKRKSSCNPGQKCPYQVHLQSDGNLKKGKTHFVAAKVESKPLRSIIRCKKTPSNHRARFSPRESKKHVLKSDKLDKSMMGYDWIAGCLDNDSYINEQSDQFFQDIEEFRRLNRDECKTAVKDIDISPKDTAKLITVSSQSQKENYPLCCNGKGSYMLNNRLNLIPIHGPYSECPTCQLKRSCKCEGDSNYVRVSIPRSTLKSPYRLRPHRRKSYDPSDSVALSTHCLAGWQNSKPAYAPGPTNVDLASHAAATGLTSVRAFKELKK